jgi:hypothetical protein
MDSNNLMLIVTDFKNNHYELHKKSFAMFNNKKNKLNKK